MYFMNATLTPAAEAVYDALAEAYDALTADYCHERWLTELERLALGHGLVGRRVLDIACGTGKSFMPLLRRGYEVTACDISAAMIHQARLKAPEADVFVADMRSLGSVGSFDLVTCLDDALNYLTDPAEMLTALRGVRDNLAPRGIALWDLNSLCMYRTAFASDWVCEREGFFIAWQGAATDDFAPSAIAEATVDVFTRGRGRDWKRRRSRHRQRHWPAAAIAEIAARAGLQLVEVRGQRGGARLDDSVDEELHTKIVFVARRDDHDGRKGGEGMTIGAP
jgi:SAM-dependent methyltransferase